MTPVSVSPNNFPSPPAVQSPRHIKSESRGGYEHSQPEDDEDSPIHDGDEPSKKKQKRNKPTLSCHECVERKTKVRKVGSWLFSVCGIDTLSSV